MIILKPLKKLVSLVGMMSRKKTEGISSFFNKKIVKRTDNFPNGKEKINGRCNTNERNDTGRGHISR